ncbi:MAG TPA: long-chain fatty acid--CoA ligase [Candidatus Angelobacter sp.]|jgi:long-chain acyl-CoA synthetase|nr:long-chain fatty acid--CoA ligase [Candidatus Angelobacter sp.]
MTLTLDAPATGLVPTHHPVTTLVDHFWRQVDVQAHRPAMYAYRGGPWAMTTWGEFGERVWRIAAYLVSEGVPDGTHVAIWSENRPEWHIADMGTLSAHLCPTPIYHSLSAAEGAYVLGHSGSAVVFVDSERIVERVLGVRTTLPALQRIVVVDTDVPVSEDGFVISFAEALSRGAAALNAGGLPEVDRRIAAVAPDDVATLVYTSGTTGPPKAVMITHRNVDAAMRHFTSRIPVSSNDRVISYLPLAHVAERLSSEYRQYIFGNAVHFAASFGMLAAHLRDVRPTVFVGVPRVWEKVADRIRHEVGELPAPRRLLARWAIAEGRRAVDRRQTGRRLGRIRARRLALADRLVLHHIRVQVGLDQATVLITAAAPISPDVLRSLHAVGLEVSELYGMSEDVGVTSVNPIGAVRIGTVGPPLPGVDVKIAPDGEILVRCGAVFAGYYKDSAATSDVLVDGWLRTGDVGEFDDAGYLRITDRKKDLIITAGGKNVSPTNIEVALKEHPLIGNAVAIGDQRPYISALLTLDSDQAFEFAREHRLDGSLAELAEHPLVRAEVQSHVDAVNAQLAHVEQVKRWQLLPVDFTVGEELTPTFKVRRKVVAQRYATVIDANYGKG